MSNEPSKQRPRVNRTYVIVAIIFVIVLLLLYYGFLLALEWWDGVYGD